MIYHISSLGRSFELRGWQVESLKLFPGDAFCLNLEDETKHILSAWVQRRRGIWGRVGWGVRGEGNIFAM